MLSRIHASVSIFLGVSLLLFGISAFLLLRVNAFKERAIAAPGTVVRLLVHGGKGGSTYQPVVRYRTRDGEVVEFTSLVAQSPPAYREGQTVEVLYEPGKPQAAQLNGFVDLYFAPLFTGFAGVIFGVFHLVRGRRSRQPLR